jgi:RHS repeat-associated protein
VYLFAGEQYDAALGLYYNRARYLNTSTGRFWSMDAFEGDPESPISLHKYLYANSDPVDNSDPGGRESLVGALGGALLAVVRRGVNRLNDLPPTLVGQDREGNPVRINTANITEKGLLVGIPAKPLPWFATFLQKVKGISESEKVAITVQFVEGLEGETPEK